MSFGSILKKAANVATGGLSGYLFDRGQAGNDYAGGMAQARSDIQQGYAKAAPELSKGMRAASAEAQKGYNAAEETARTGFASAADQLRTGGQEAIGTAKSGMQAAQGQYETQPMVASRQELYNRVLGKGGLDEATLAQMRAGEIEQAGSALKGAERGISKFAGDAGASGLAAENAARAAAQIGATKAAGLRDINVGNAQLARQEQTGAMSALGQEAQARSALSADEAKLVSGLQQQLATGTANLTNDQTKALSDIATRRGESLSQLQKDLASGTAQLTVEEAKAIAELQSAQAGAQYAVGSQKGLLGSIFG